jgi:hypothetical protein
MELSTTREATSGHSTVSQHFTEPEGSIPNSQELSTCSYPEPDQTSPHSPILMVGGYLSSQYGASLGCGWRNGLQLWRVTANIFNK